MKGSKASASKNQISIESNKLSGSSKKNLPLIASKSPRLNSCEDSTMNSANYDPSSWGHPSAFNLNSNPIKLYTKRSLNINSLNKDPSKLNKFTTKISIDNINMNNITNEILDCEFLPKHKKDSNLPNLPLQKQKRNSFAINSKKLQCSMTSLIPPKATKIKPTIQGNNLTSGKDSKESPLISSYKFKNRSSKKIPEIQTIDLTSIYKPVNTVSSVSVSFSSKNKISPIINTQKSLKSDVKLPKGFFDIFSNIKNLISAFKRHFKNSSKSKYNEMPRIIVNFNELNEDIHKINSKFTETNRLEKHEVTSLETYPNTMKNINLINTHSEKRISIYKSFFDIFSQSLSEIKELLTEKVSTKQVQFEKVSLEEESINSKLKEKLQYKKSKKELGMDLNRNLSKKLSRRIISKKMLGYIVDEDNVEMNMDDSISEGARVKMPHKNYTVKKPKDMLFQFRVLTDGDLDISLSESVSHSEEEVISNCEEGQLKKNRSRSLLNIKKTRNLLNISDGLKEKKLKDGSISPGKVIQLFNDDSISKVFFILILDK
jgi:hypothetical protein